jgi:multidrug resistance protein, MATE family
MTSIRQRIVDRWRGPGGAAEVLILAWPLMVSNGFYTVQGMIDSLMLSEYDIRAVGASSASTMLFWTVLQLPHSTAMYATNFVAQYHGAGRSRRVGRVVWQAMYVSMLCGLLVWLMAPLAGWAVGLGKHAPDLQRLEVSYLRVLCAGAIPLLLHGAISSFFVGLGQTRTVVTIDLISTVVNAALNWVLIFGNLGAPRLGIVGAGWATVIAAWVSALLGLVLMLAPRNREQFGTLIGWRPHARIVRRLITFGVPGGLEWTLDSLAWALFVWLVGTIGAAELSATSIALNLNMIAYMPTLGLAQAAAVLVGQRLGEQRIDLAERSVWTTFGLAWGLMAVLGLSFVLFSAQYVALFRPGTGDEAATWFRVTQLLPTLLTFVAGYCLFDSMNMVFASALKGAGDVRFPTIVSMSLSWSMLVLPTWLVLQRTNALFLAWSFATVYVLALALVFWWRFRSGKWQGQQLIDWSAETAMFTAQFPTVARVPAMVESSGAQLALDEEIDDDG